MTVARMETAAAKSPAAPSPTSDREIVQTRVYDAPRELLWAAFTNAEHLKHWFGPRGFTIATKSADIRVGGSWVFDMIGPDGKVWPNVMEYRELKKPERMVFDHGDGAERSFQVVITFVSEAPNKTRVTMTSTFPTAQEVEMVKKFGAVELGKQTMEKLAEYVAKNAEALAR